MSIHFNILPHQCRPCVSGTTLAVMLKREAWSNFYNDALCRGLYTRVWGGGEAIYNQCIT